MKNMRKKRMPQQPVEEKVEIRMENKANAISQQEALKSVLERSDGLEYNLYVLYYCHHLPYSEIAKQLSMKESYVGVRIHRLNRKLKITLQNENLKELRQALYEGSTHC